MKTSKPPPALDEKLRAFALLSQCQAELAHELCRLLPEAPRKRRARVDRPDRRPRTRRRR